MGMSSCVCKYDVSHIQRLFLTIFPYTNRVGTSPDVPIVSLTTFCAMSSANPVTNRGSAWRIF